MWKNLKSAFVEFFHVNRVIKYMVFNYYNAILWELFYVMRLYIETKFATMSNFLNS